MKTKIISCSILVLFFACRPAEENGNSEEEAVKTEVAVVKPSFQKLSGFTELNATTQYQRKSTIRATVTGYISKLEELPGDHINPGKTICYISTKEQQALVGIDTSELRGFNRPM